MKRNAKEFPISSYVAAGDLIFLAGHGPRDVETGEVMRSDIKYQTKKTLENIEKTLSKENLTLSDIVSVTTYIRNIDDLKEYNETYKEIMLEPYPARTTIRADLVVPDINIEISVIAQKKKV